MRRAEDPQSTTAFARCARCGAPFNCGRDDPAGCWCARLPALPRERYEEAAGCLCEACLRRMLDHPADGASRQ